MSKINDGGNAFPYQTGTEAQYAGESLPGMSLRDWFAGQVLSAIAKRFIREYRRKGGSSGWIGEAVSEEEELGHADADAITVAASAAYDLADAMIAERSKS